MIYRAGLACDSSEGEVGTGDDIPRSVPSFGRLAAKEAIVSKMSSVISWPRSQSQSSKQRRRVAYGDEGDLLHGHAKERRPPRRRRCCVEESHCGCRGGELRRSKRVEVPTGDDRIKNIEWEGISFGYGVCVCVCVSRFVSFAWGIIRFVWGLGVLSRRPRSRFRG